MLGLGENLGRRIHESDFPHKDLSIFAAAYRNSVPATVHVGIGYDIIHEHPNCDGRALGAASYRDFLIFTKTMENLEGGIMLNFGSAIMGPEVYLKALSMVRNVAHPAGTRDQELHHGRVRPGAHPGRHSPRIAQDRSRLLFPPPQDDPGKDRGRWGREFLFLWRSSRDRGCPCGAPYWSCNHDHS